MQPSPYTPGEVARVVPGRAKQLAEVDERLSTLVDLGRLVSRLRVDHAPRGYGKTSLLREYQRRATARDVLTVWVTAGEEQGHQTRSRILPRPPVLCRSRIRIRGPFDPTRRS